MIELQQDLWTVDADWICITTNGYIKKNGDAVMGRGCAYEATQRYPEIASLLGFGLKHNGNIVQHIYTDWIYKRDRVYQDIYAFPVKHNWRDLADLKLIERSCQQLLELYEYRGTPRIAIPRPGCGNGGLSWNVVKPVCEKYFTTDRFIIVDKPGIYTIDVEPV